MLWEEHESVVYCIEQIGVKIAGFNLYGTLVNKDLNLLYNNTREKLLQLYREGYTVILFINNKNTVTIKENVERLRRRLNFPLNVFIATQTDHYKKPMTGMWDLYKGIAKSNDITGFICGDCAGRKYRKKEEDYNSNDVFFAHNIRLPFIYPEDLFEQPKRSFRIKEYPFIPTPMNDPFLWDTFQKETRNKKHIVITVGCSSHFRNIFIDLLINQVRRSYFIAYSVEELEIGIKENRDIIFNSANPVRKHIHDLIGKKYQKVILSFDISQHIIHHINNYMTQKEEGHKREQTWKIDKYYESLREPTMDEGIIFRVELGHVIKEISKEYYYHYDIMKLI
jgi:DNA 3'-phosphatase